MGYTINSDGTLTAPFAPGYHHATNSWNTNIPKWVQDESNAKKNIIMKDYYDKKREC
jgi:hypothetical protein